MTARGYTKALHVDKSAPRGCQCPEDFDHDGKCQNALSERKAYKCAPCSSGWHLDTGCVKYVPKGFKTLTTQCDRCGWDSADHVLTDEMRALQTPLR